MRQRIALLLLALAPLSGAQAAEPRVYPDRLPHGAVIDDVRLKRTAVDVDYFAPVVVAQNEPARRVEPPPPPSIDEPGPEPESAPLLSPAPAGDDSDTVTLKEAVPEAQEKVLPAARAETPVTSHTTAGSAPLPEKIHSPDEIAPSVTIRAEGDVTVEEYRRDGHIYMVRVVPKRGIAYTYLDTDGDGRLEGDPKEGPMQPVYYTVYEWE